MISVSCRILLATMSMASSSLASTPHFDDERLPSPFQLMTPVDVIQDELHDLKREVTTRFTWGTENDNQYFYDRMAIIFGKIGELSTGPCTECSVKLEDFAIPKETSNPLESVSSQYLSKLAMANDLRKKISRLIEDLLQYKVLKYEAMGFEIAQ